MPISTTKNLCRGFRAPSTTSSDPQNKVLNVHDLNTCTQTHAQVAKKLWDIMLSVVLNPIFFIDWQLLAKLVETQGSYSSRNR
ncbi:MAG: hypothetical protein BYD32DRAFT_156558 [Podila humilis]|nr:MAG: hypothetical protein BYD32DRAFT_156558 [Podila humilis]